MKININLRILVIVIAGTVLNGSHTKFSLKRKKDPVQFFRKGSYDLGRFNSFLDLCNEASEINCEDWEQNEVIFQNRHPDTGFGL